MLDLAGPLREWIEEGREFAVATVVAVGGSAPRPPGAALAVAGDGTAIGSVSGGCVEGAVYELCVQALDDGETRVERFGYSDEDAFAVGLTCGGTIDIMITPFTADRPDESPGTPPVRTPSPGTPPVRTPSAAAAPVGTPPVGVPPAPTPPAALPLVPRPPRAATAFAAVSAAGRGEPVALARVVRGPAELLGGALLVRPDGAPEGGLGGHPALDRTLAAEARALLESGRTGTVELSEDGSHCPGGLTLLVESAVPPPRMIVFGAIDFASALVGAGKFLGYHVTVCDARPVFATRARFPDADEIVVDWPDRYLRGTPTDRRTVLCVLTHDAKFDVPLLKEALRLPVAYVGAMGSRRTHEDRARRLREEGVSASELARLRSPIGLDLGARTPEETAVSIAAEIIAARHGATGTPLTDTDRPIHTPRAA
ncbi:XdhC family protein [Streptomyces sp. NPDC085931]|uniref:XdhC family protein n=1 Tax=Streptomyces sp. NPDC085931 TaxID=3365740 RepID=UPI0037D83395